MIQNSKMNQTFYIRNQYALKITLHLRDFISLFKLYLNYFFNFYYYLIIFYLNMLGYFYEENDIIKQKGNFYCKSYFII